MAGNIFITGDTHGEHDMRKLSSKKWPEGKNLDRDDYVIIAGDMGILWGNEFNNPMEKHLKNWYGELKGWTTLFVDGNHENHKRLNDLPVEEKFGGKVGVVREHIYHLRRGEVYTINGKTFFTFGGAMSWDKYHRTVDISWWAEEEATHEQCEYAMANLDKVGWEVDYIITHTIPNEIVPMFGFSNNKNGEKCATANFLNTIARQAKFKDWYTGHFHIDKDIGKYHTLYYDIRQLV